MPKYRKRRQIVDAVQWTINIRGLPWIKYDEIAAKHYVDLANTERAYLAEGDWLVYESGSIAPPRRLKPAQFTEAYEPVGSVVAEMLGDSEMDDYIDMDDWTHPGKVIPVADWQPIGMVFDKLCDDLERVERPSGYAAAVEGLSQYKYSSRPETTTQIYERALEDLEKLWELARGLELQLEAEAEHTAAADEEIDRLRQLLMAAPSSAELDQLRGELAAARAALPAKPW